MHARGLLKTDVYNCTVTNCLKADVQRRLFKQSRMKKAGIISTRKTINSSKLQKCLLLNTRHHHSQAIRIQLHTPQRTNPQSKWQGVSTCREHLLSTRTNALANCAESRQSSRGPPSTRKTSLISNSIPRLLSGQLHHENYLGDSSTHTHRRSTSKLHAQVSTSSLILCCALERSIIIRNPTKLGRKGLCGSSLKKATETLTESMESRLNSSGIFSQDSQRGSSAVKSQIH